MWGVGILIINNNKERRTLVEGVGRSREISGMCYYPKGNNVSCSTRYFPISTASVPNIIRLTGGLTTSLIIITPSSPLITKVISTLGTRNFTAFNPGTTTTVVRNSGIFSGGLVLGCGVPATRCGIFSGPYSILACVGRGGRFPTIVGTSNLTLNGNIVVPRGLRRTRGNIRRVVRSGVFNRDNGRIIIRRFLANPRISILTFASNGYIGPVISSVSRGHTLSNSGNLGANNVNAISPGPCCATSVTGRYVRGVFLPAVSTVGGRKHAFGNYLCFNLVLAPGKPGIVRCGYHFNSPRARIILPHLGASVVSVFRTVGGNALTRLSVR